MELSRRLLALLLALLAVCGCFSSAALAAEEDPAAEPDGEGTAQDGTHEYYGPGYVLREQTVIAEDETPLAGAPLVEQECCILHLVLMLGALAVTIYYIYDRKRRQEREFEIRSEL